ncbi:MAG TPA: TauD/TfdA family dioxygenase [Thermoanaerobaculia bacterium]|nr:TauD/TfdA family dioxygenase [Thermoanaerobaculia bacterium]
MSAANPRIAPLQRLAGAPRQAVDTEQARLIVARELGDGSPFEDEVSAELEAAYRDPMVLFPWRKGDVLLLDNMLVAPARAPFKGPRKIAVSMAEPVSRVDRQ